MEETNTLLQQQLTDAIFDCLQNHIYSNAVFLAERLVAEHDSEDNRGILAECYLADMKAYKAFYILKDCKSEQNRYKFALTCLKLNKLKEAEKALSAPSLYENSNSKYLININIKPENVPNGSYGLYLLGLIYEKLQRTSEAKDYYKRALDLNPSLWSAYEKLLKLGELSDPAEFFVDSKFKLYENNRKQNISSYLPLYKNNSSTQQNKNTSQIRQEVINLDDRHNEKISNIYQSDNELYTPNMQNASSNRPKSSLFPKSLNFNSNSNSISGIANFSINLDDSNSTHSLMRNPGSNSINQFFSSNPGQRPNTFSSFPNHHLQSQSRVPLPKINESEFVMPLNPNLYPHAKHQLQTSYINTSLNSGQHISKQPIKDLVNLLIRLGEPYLYLLSYNCQQAIEGFHRLPSQHYNTGWVLSNIGRAYWECVKYSEAEKYFEEAYRIEPYRLEGLEYYSTCLWHMKKQVELAHLAYTALEKSLFAPEAWIVLGNCYSLQKEHENALKFFNRAIQLNPTFAYAHTLSGHEFVYNEDFTKAKKCFEFALNIDLRHYNAWWGLGNIFYKQEKYEKAIDHFQKAISINSKNPVLYSYLGMTYAAQDDLDQALRYFQQSEALDDKNVLNRFQKANVLVKMERYNNALQELEKLRALMPKEAPIPQLIGRIYKQLGDIDKAHLFFTLALDLDTKDSQRIKGMLDSLHNNNDFNEDTDI